MFAATGNVVGNRSLLIDKVIPLLMHAKIVQLP